MRANATGLNDAGTLTSDGLTLYFTRADPSHQLPPQIWRAQRSSRNAPFDEPSHLEGLGSFVEAPALSPDGATLYYHRRDGDHYGLWKVDLGGTVRRTVSPCAKSHA